MNTRRHRILLLDSDEQTLIDLQQYLEDQGFDTTVTWDVVEALQLARSRQFDLLLVGDHSSQVTGGEVLRELQYSRVSLPCVIVQKKAGTFNADYFYSLGARGVITGWNRKNIAECLWEYFPKRVRAAAMAASNSGQWPVETGFFTGHWPLTTASYNLQLL